MPSKIQFLNEKIKDRQDQLRFYRLCLSEDYLARQIAFERDIISKRESYISFLQRTAETAPEAVIHIEADLLSLKEELSQEQARQFSENLSRGLPRPKPATAVIPINKDEVLLQCLITGQGMSREQAVALVNEARRQTGKEPL